MRRQGIDPSALRELTRLLAAPPRQVRGAPVVVSRDVLVTLERLVAADVVVFNDMAPLRRFEWAGSDSFEPDLAEGACDGDEGGDGDEDPFWDLYWQSPFCNYPDTTGDLSVTVGTDFHSVREARQTPLHVYLAQFWPVFDRSMMLPLPGPLGHSRRIRFLRQSGREFDDTDRAVAALVKPHLVAYLHALDLASRGIAPLTNRQRQLMSLVAEGFSNVQIARALGITPDTVRTHLQQIYARLGVASRGEAVAVVSAPGEVRSLESALGLARHATTRDSAMA